MTGLPKVILILFALLAAIVLGASALQKSYLAPRGALREQIAQAEGTLSNYRQAERDRRSVSSQLQAYIDRTLGPNLETVDHRLRSRLNRLAEQSKVQGVSVSTEGTGKPRLSPARGKFRASSQRALRDEIDFVELEASISGVGSLADVVRLVSLIEAEAWIKRIDFVRLDPRDNGARLAMTLRLTTLFVPGRAPRTEPDAPVPADVQARFASLVNDNPFRVPPPPAPPPPKPEPKPDTPVAPPPPPPFPFGEWALTGIAQGPSGLEAWLLHRPSGATRVLAIGQQLDAAVFSGATGEAAEFTQSGLRFIVAVGATMDQRTPTGL